MREGGVPVSGNWPSELNQMALISEEQQFGDLALGQVAHAHLCEQFYGGYCFVLMEAKFYGHGGLPLGCSLTVLGGKRTAVRAMLKACR